MAIDVYSLCPGGTGRKIKFCCGDFLGELEKIDRMVEGEQYASCLNHIEQLRRQPANHERQCLLAYQTMLLRATGQLEAAQKSAAEFVQKYPANQIALAESSMLATMRDDFCAAMDFWQLAVSEGKGTWSWRTYQAAEMLAEALIDQGQWLPAKAILTFLALLARDESEASRALGDLLRRPEMPLLLKGETALPQAPEQAPWKKRFGEAIAPMAYGDWRTTEANLSRLAGDAPDSWQIWRRLATVRGWLGNTRGAIEALRKFASLEMPLEDAVEAEAAAMLLSEAPLGDAQPVLRVVLTIKDVDRVQEALLSHANVRPISLDPLAFSSADSPPPKSACMVYDRPDPESLEGISYTAMPRFMGQIFIFGRQTDREARLEIVHVTGRELQQIKTMLNDTAGEWLNGDEQIEQLTSVSASEELLRPQWRTHPQITLRQLREMAADYRRNVVLNVWPEMRLGALDGLTPREAAAQAKYRIKVLAAIMVLQSYLDGVRSKLDLNELRGQLGLPVLEPIEAEAGQTEAVPLVRLGRIVAEKLSDNDLVRAFHRSVSFYHRIAAMKLGKELIDRPSFENRRERAQAYTVLARLEDDLDMALSYIEAGRKSADAGGKSHAYWDLEELSLRFSRLEMREAMELMMHIQAAHINEPNVSLVLTQILVEVGLLRPDGTPATPTGYAETEAAQAAATAAEPGKIWTPESESQGGGKLWVPE